jgi:hypothetical protein
MYTCLLRIFQLSQVTSCSSAYFFTIFHILICILDIICRALTPVNCIGQNHGLRLVPKEDQIDGDALRRRQSDFNWSRADVPKAG